MFNILFGWRKASKCKKLIKRVQCRLKLLKNKRICIAKQLRKDVAELLKHGHDRAAFKRVEQVVIDENMVQVYDLLYQFCEFVNINLPYICKHRDCPNDIKEAVSALIFSSARFGELPELLSIRKLFGGRYGEKFVAAALELPPGNFVTGQVIEYLEMKRVPNDVKYRLLDEISRSFAQTEQLCLEYKHELRENENANGWKRERNDENDVAELELFVRREREKDSKIMYEEKKFWRDSCFGLRKEGNFGNEIETCSENSAKLGEEVIYLDDIEEFISPMIKDGSLQDQRLFVFRSFGVSSNAKTGCINVMNVDSSPEIRCKSRYQRGGSTVLGQSGGGGGNDDGLGQPWPRYEAMEAKEFSSRYHLEKDDVVGRRILPSTTQPRGRLLCLVKGLERVMWRIILIDRTHILSINHTRFTLLVNMSIRSFRIMMSWQPSSWS